MSCVLGVGLKSDPDTRPPEEGDEISFRLCLQDAVSGDARGCARRAVVSMDLGTACEDSLRAQTAVSESRAVFSVTLDVLTGSGRRDQVSRQGKIGT